MESLSQKGSVFLTANTSFFDNEAESNGGVMLVIQGFFHITNCNFSRNHRSMYFFSSNVTSMCSKVMSNNSLTRLPVD